MVYVSVCQTRQSASAICHPERSRKSDAIADDADLGLAKANKLARTRGMTAQSAVIVRPKKNPAEAGF